MFIPEDIERMGSVAASEELLLSPVPGDDIPESLWERIVNLRLEQQNSYRFWKRRGGSVTDVEVTGIILTLFDFTAFISGFNNDFIAIHTNAGHIYLYNANSESLDLIFEAEFSTSRQVQFVQNGIYLYVFDYDGGAAKYYDVQRDESNDFNGQLASHITGFTRSDGDLPTGDKLSEDDLRWRYYAIIGVLPDGSVTFPSRPMPVWADQADISGASSPEFELTFTAGPTVTENYLIATRWNADKETALQPSTEDLPSGPWFIVKAIPPDTLTITDDTADDDLDSPISELLAMSGGIPTIFVPNQIKPNTVTSISGTLIFGGYRINRPVPDLYSDVENADGKNVFYDFNGSDIGASLAVAFQYTDGSYSGIIDGPALKDGEINLTPDDAIASTVEFTLNTGSVGSCEEPHTLFDLTINFDGVETVLTDLPIGGGLPIIISIINQLNADHTNWTFAQKPDTNNVIVGTHVSAGDNNGIQLTPNVSNIHGGSEECPDMVTPNAIGSESTGGSTAAGLKVSGNWLQIQNTNTLISKAWVLGKVGTDYHVLEEIEINDGRLHGAVMYLPNDVGDITNKALFVPPQIEQTAVMLDNYITTSVAFQNIDIRSQQRIADRSKIKRVVPETYDVDKTLLRYRLQVFTERNFQIVYLTSSGDTYDSDAEIVMDNLRVKSPEGITRLMETTFVQTNDGLFSIDESVTKITDARAYDVLSLDLQCVAFNPNYNEYWFIFNSNTVFVWNGQWGKRYEFSFTGATIRHGLYAFGHLRLGVGTSLYRTDLSNSNQDDGNDFEGMATTRHLGRPNEQVKIMEILVAGQHLTGQVSLDMQSARLERAADDGWSDDFTEDEAGDEQKLQIYGTSWRFNTRGVMPKMRLSIHAGDSTPAFAEYISMRVVKTPNVGRARI